MPILPSGISAGPEGDCELRPSVLRDYSPKTLACYECRLVHYQQWCQLRRYQPSIDAITSAKILHYVANQIARWGDTADLNLEGYRRYRPETIRQAINALIYWAERATGEAPDDRAPKELLRRFTTTFNQATPPAWRVPGRKSPRQRNPPMQRPQPGNTQFTLFDSGN